ncbi:hypothetical protein JKP88DRAFT_267101 [Tribonema minus]|uniref:Uncharacterized protein n=1 Tax=Tribonema minus TaxID=303371 RepID=A0A836CNJ9_9STRA|nr:hypothetical protein JKP88DRAFT_267101 [Tribonema minus]
MSQQHDMTLQPEPMLRLLRVGPLSLLMTIPSHALLADFTSRGLRCEVFTPNAVTIACAGDMWLQLVVRICVRVAMRLRVTGRLFLRWHTLQVMLFNDSGNTREYVARALVQPSPSVDAMHAGHPHRALVFICVTMAPYGLLLLWMLRALQVTGVTESNAYEIMISAHTNVPQPCFCAQRRAAAAAIALSCYRRWRPRCNSATPLTTATPLCQLPLPRHWHNGRAGMSLVGIWHSELAELYSDQLKARGLISEIFPVD